MSGEHGAKILIVINRRVHQALVVEGRRRGLTAPQEISRRIEEEYGVGGRLVTTPLEPLRAIGPKRPNGSLPQGVQRMVFTVPAAVKAAVMRMCREEGVTQAEFGMLCMEMAVSREAQTLRELRTYLAAGRRYDPWHKSR